MVRPFFLEQIKKASPAHQAALKRMWERPSSLEEKLEQVRRNKEIRRQNMLEKQKKTEDKELKNCLLIQRILFTLHQHCHLQSLSPE